MILDLSLATPCTDSDQPFVPPLADDVALRFSKSSLKLQESAPCRRCRVHRCSQRPKCNAPCCRWRMKMIRSPASRSKRSRLRTNSMSFLRKKSRQAARPGRLAFAPEARSSEYVAKHIRPHRETRPYRIRSRGNPSTDESMIPIGSADRLHRLHGRHLRPTRIRGWDQSRQETRIRS